MAAIAVAIASEIRPFPLPQRAPSLSPEEGERESLAARAEFLRSAMRVSK
jgi:hypothetical protein